MASRWLRGRIVAITGTKGKSTTTTLTGRMLEAGGHTVLVGGNIGHAAERAGRCLHARDDPRGRGEQLPARVDRDVQAVDLGAPEFLARPSRSARQCRRVRGSEGAHLHQPDGCRLGGRQCRRSSRRHAWQRMRRRESCWFSMTDSLASGVLVHGDSIVRRTDEGDQPLVPLASIRLLGPSPDRRRAGRVGGGVDRRRRCGSDDAARSKVSQGSSTRSSRSPSSAA